MLETASQAIIRLGEDAMKTSWRRLDAFSVTFSCIPRRLQGAFKTSSKDNCKTSWRYLEHALRRCLEDIFARHFANIFAVVFKTSWKKKNCYAEDVFKMSSKARNICPEVHSSKTIAHWIKLQIYRENANKNHLLQSNLISNHNEVRLIIMLSPTELKDMKNNFPKERKNWEAVCKRFLHYVIPFPDKISLFESFG